jgi:1,2-phenylacetyl-CoA epoxidase catalytic subunit
MKDIYFLKWNFLMIFGLKTLGETWHTLLVYWVANVPLKEMIFHITFSQRWLLKLSTTSKKKINKEYLCFSLAPFQV